MPLYYWIKFSFLLNLAYVTFTQLTLLHIHTTYFTINSLYTKTIHIKNCHTTCAHYQTHIELNLQRSLYITEKPYLQCNKYTLNAYKIYSYLYYLLTSYSYNMRVLCYSHSYLHKNLNTASTLSYFNKPHKYG